ncbi:MAG: ATP-binding protein [Planctomycetota bacterium]
MSYKTFKKLLGETSLERKCRFLFGSGLLLLITASFYLYGRLTADLVEEQNLINGRLSTVPIILFKHWKYREENVGFRRQLDDMLGELKAGTLKNSWELFKADTEGTADAGHLPSDAAGHEALDLLRQGRPEFFQIDEKGEYVYYGAVKASKTCLECHYHQTPHAKEGDLIGMAKVSFSMQETKRALAMNNAILLATAIGTAFLAMLAAYAIVRYVVVKPVLHLKDVSDSIAKGNLDLRADIRTGDEFEELSHAFYRMLRHLVAVQEELREVNHDLDTKVDELAKVNLALFETNNLKSQFLATMSHELRTPLNSILGFSDVLGSAGNLDDRQHRYVRNIQTSGKDLLTLINDILDLAKIEGGKMELHIAELSLLDLIERLLGMVRPLAEKKNIDLIGEVDPSIPLLKQDTGKVQQILYNLLSNAIKFTPEGGSVRVLARRVNNDFFELICEDTGVGIAMEEQETIFEKFRQGNLTPGGNSALTREFAGTGLGLSIVKELSKLLGGEVSLQSEMGKGSTFTIRLPFQIREQLPLPEDPLQQHAVELSKLRRLDLTRLSGTK